MTYWVTSDTHFGHKNIMEYCGRPFKTVEEMDSVMIDRWNTLVKTYDTVFHLGDLVFKTGHLDIKERLNGTIIHIQGNHDNRSSNARTIIQHVLVEYGGYKFFLVHNPSHASTKHISLVGHVHEKWTHMWNIPCQQWNINVGVDRWDFRPVKLDTIIKYMRRTRICKT